MKFYVISDNLDTYMGMRLAGMEGTVLRGREEVLAKVREVMGRSDVGMLLLTEKLAQLCEKELYELKLSCKRPLIVEIPDRHGGHATSALERYVSEAIGVKM